MCECTTIVSVPLFYLSCNFTLIFFPDFEKFPWLNQPCNALGQSLFGTVTTVNDVTATTANVATATTANVATATTITGASATTVTDATANVATATTVTDATASTAKVATATTVTGATATTTNVANAITVTDATAITVTDATATTVTDATATTVTDATLANVYTFGNLTSVTAGTVNTAVVDMVSNNVCNVTVASDATVATIANVDSAATVAPSDELNSIDGLNASVSRGNDSNWLEYSTLMGNTLPLKSKLVYLKSYSDLETYLKNEKKIVAGVVPSEHAMLKYFFFFEKRPSFSSVDYLVFC